MTMYVMITHREGGLNIRNFVSKKTEVLHRLNAECNEQVMEMIKLTNDTKILGMYWDIQEDKLLWKNCIKYSRYH